MSVEEQNKALFHRWFGEVWNKGNYDVAYEIIDPNFTVHGAGGQVVKQGLDGLIEFVKVWRTAFPDGQMTVDALIAEGELVAARPIWRGTHQGDLYNIPPTGKMVVVESFTIDKIVNGKIAESWGEADMLGVMQQMGVISQPGLGIPTSTPKQQPTQGQQLPFAQTNNKALFLRFYQILNEGNIDAAREVVDIANYVEHSMGSTMSFEGLRQTYTMLRQALPDLHFATDLNLMISDGDRVVFREVITGTHTGGPLFGAPPSGKRLDWTHNDMVRIASGKIVERWVCADLLRLMQQIGLAPSMS